MIGVLTLYQDWLPFLVAIGYVVLHHGLAGVISAETVYNHPAAVASPWRWAFVDGIFVLAASVAHIVAWRTNENQLLRDPLTGLPSRLLFIHRLTIAVGERVLRSFSLPFHLSHGETMSAANLGIALAADPDQDVEDLIRDADAAVYRAKEAGGGRLMLFDEVTRQRALTRLHTENALRRAIEREEFRVSFQPEVSVETGTIVGLEAPCAGSTPSAACCSPTSSSRSPRRPA